MIQNLFRCISLIMLYKINLGIMCTCVAVDCRHVNIQLLFRLSHTFSCFLFSGTADHLEKSSAFKGFEESRTSFVPLSRDDAFVSLKGAGEDAYEHFFSPASSKSRRAFRRPTSFRHNAFFTSSRIRGAFSDRTRSNDESLYPQPWTKVRRPICFANRNGIAVRQGEFADQTIRKF